MQARARLTSKGQITLPIEVRRALGLRVGDLVAFESGADGFSIRPMRPATEFAELEGIWRTGDGASTGQVDAWLRDLRGYPDDEA